MNQIYSRSEYPIKSNLQFQIQVCYQGNHNLCNSITKQINLFSPRNQFHGPFLWNIVEIINVFEHGKQ